MKQVIRVQALYSLKQKDRSLLPKGVYTQDAPGGIPQLILDEVARGAKTVRVLEWGKEETKAKKVSAPVEEAPEEDILDESSEDDEKEAKPEKATKPKRLPRKK